MRIQRCIGAVVMAAMLSLTACITLPRAIDDLPAGDWRFRLGDPRNAAFVTERVPSQVRVAWSEGIGRGLPALPIIQDALIISVVSGGGIVTASTENGSRHWARRFNGSIAGQALRVGDRVYFATQHRNGAVYALDLHRGRRSWTRRLEARAAAEPAYADGRLFIATERGDVLALDAATGELQWRTRLSARAAQPPLVLGDELLVAVRDTLIRLERSGGSVRARHVLAGEPSAPLAMAGDTVIVAMQPRIVAAYADRGQRELWRHELAAPVLAAPVITADGVFVLSRNADVYRLDGGFAEPIASLRGAATESLTVTADGILVGLLDGRVVFLRRTGEVVWEERVSGSVRAPAVVRNAAVYVGTLSGRLTKLIAS